jgi:RNA polymerase sigma-70 factor (ECF subfamily)
MRDAPSVAINELAANLFRSGRPSPAANQELGKLLMWLYPRVVAMLRYGFNVKNSADQDELFQEVVLRFFQYQKSYNPDKPFLCWFYQIVRNVALDFRKRDCTREQHEEPFQLEYLVDFHERGYSVDRETMVREALYRLEKLDREVLWLFYYEGFTEQELATYLDVSHSNAKAYLRRARRRLRGILSPRSLSEPKRREEVGA